MRIFPCPKNRIMRGPGVDVLNQFPYNLNLSKEKQPQRLDCGGQQVQLLVSHRTRAAIEDFRQARQQHYHWCCHSVTPAIAALYFAKNSGKCLGGLTYCGSPAQSVSTANRGTARIRRPTRGRKTDCEAMDGTISQRRL